MRLQNEPFMVNFKFTKFHYVLPTDSIILDHTVLKPISKLVKYIFNTYIFSSKNFPAIFNFFPKIKSIYKHNKPFIVNNRMYFISFVVDYPDMINAKNNSVSNHMIYEHKSKI
jgi:hypothetical protein